MQDLASEEQLPLPEAEGEDGGKALMTVTETSRANTANQVDHMMADVRNRGGDVSGAWEMDAVEVRTGDCR